MKVVISESRDGAAAAAGLGAFEIPHDSRAIERPDAPGAREAGPPGLPAGVPAPAVDRVATDGRPVERCVPVCPAEAPHDRSDLR